MYGPRSADRAAQMIYVKQIFLAGNQRPVGLYQPRGRLMQRGGRPENHRSPRAGHALAHQRAHDRIVHHRWGAENCGRKRVYARLRYKCVVPGANGRGGGVRHCPHDMTMPLACPISSLRCCFVWAICSSCLVAEGGPCRRYPGVLKVSSGCLPLKPMLPDLTTRVRHRSLGR